MNRFDITCLKCKCSIELCCCCCRVAVSWKEAKQILNLCLNTTGSGSTMPSNRKFVCYYLLGKIAEKQKSIAEAIRNYLLAETQLFNDYNDDADDVLFGMKLEINFRITASIYKCVTQPDISLDQKTLLQFVEVLKRDKGQVFTAVQLNARPSIDVIVAEDENANQIDIQPKTSLVSIQIIINHVILDLV